MYLIEKKNVHQNSPGALYKKKLKKSSIAYMQAISVQAAFQFRGRGVGVNSETSRTPIL